MKSIPKVSIYLEKSYPFIGRPLSDFNVRGIPNTAKILSIFGVTDEAFVNRKIQQLDILSMHLSVQVSTHHLVKDQKGPCELFAMAFLASCSCAKAQEDLLGKVSCQFPL